MEATHEQHEQPLSAVSHLRGPLCFTQLKDLLSDYRAKAVGTLTQSAVAYLRSSTISHNIKTADRSSNIALLECRVHLRHIKLT